MEVGRRLRGLNVQGAGLADVGDRAAIRVSLSDSAAGATRTEGEHVLRPAVTTFGELAAVRVSIRARAGWLPLEGQELVSDSDGTGSGLPAILRILLVARVEHPPLRVGQQALRIRVENTCLFALFPLLLPPQIRPRSTASFLAAGSACRQTISSGNLKEVAESV